MSEQRRRIYIEIETTDPTINFLVLRELFLSKDGSTTIQIKEHAYQLLTFDDIMLQMRTLAEQKGWSGRNTSSVRMFLVRDQNTLFEDGTLRADVVSLLLEPGQSVESFRNALYQFAKRLNPPVRFVGHTFGPVAFEILRETIESLSK